MTHFSVYDLSPDNLWTKWYEGSEKVDCDCLSVQRGEGRITRVDEAWLPLQDVCVCVVCVCEHPHMKHKPPGNVFFCIFFVLECTI